IPNYFYTNHLLNDQIDEEIYTSFNAPSPDCCSDENVYNIKSTTISTNTVWNTTFAPWGAGDGLVEDDLVVESGAKLTINGRTLKFSRNAKLIVKQGGSLVL